MEEGLLILFSDLDLFIARPANFSASTLVNNLFINSPPKMEEFFLILHLHKTKLQNTYH